MFHVRSPSEGSQETVSGLLTILWQLVPDVNGIVFKDLKQILKKEQCDVCFVFFLILSLFYQFKNQNHSFQNIIYIPQFLKITFKMKR